MRTALRTGVESFEETLSNDVWALLVQAVNRNFARNTSCGKKRDTRKKPTTKREMQKFYGIQMLIENTYGNSSHLMRSHFKELKATYRNQWPRGLGEDRFAYIRSNLVLTRDEIMVLCQLLHHNFCKVVQPTSVSNLYLLVLKNQKNLTFFKVTLATIDEQVIGYQPSAEAKAKAEAEGEPIPVVFIPRKPHANGLLNYLVNIFVSNELFFNY